MFVEFISTHAWGTGLLGCNPIHFYKHHTAAAPSARWEMAALGKIGQADAAFAMLTGDLQAILSNSSFQTNGHAIVMMRWATE